ncbi:MAG: pyruvate dehydrogenase (acetyl-transferring), homodimeric type, partial [bacterium]|nr:pyruvate dehydrogenase (acetyl-transferring), homodimeric type [bacterium]
MAKDGDSGNNLGDEALESLMTGDWIDSLEDVVALSGKERARDLLRDLQIYAQHRGIELPVTSQTPYVNTILPDQESPFPGDRAIERRIKSLARWNAMAMVVRANRENDGIGGHISTYASIATLYEIGFNHFFHGPDHESGGDLVYFQGHGSPGIYARAYLEGRLEPEHLSHFRHEVCSDQGLSSYPHPWLMPEFWQFPTVSMGLGPISAIYQARFIRYLEDRDLVRKPVGLHRDQRKVWCYIGDGETDEPEALGAISLAARARLDNLIFVINCNLQRLDGPVRGNGKIIQELEAVFRGVGWNVIKVIWGSDWDALLAKDTEGRLVKRMGEVVDGAYQKYGVEGGGYIREHFYGKDPQLAALVKDLSDDQLWKMRYGGHDPVKVYNAYKAAVEQEGRPTVILAKTIKGYGLGEAGEGRNVTHQQKKLNEEELLAFRDRFDVPLSDDQVRQVPFYRPEPESREMLYLQERRQKLGGYVPQRRVMDCGIPSAPPEIYDEFLEGSDRPASTTMVFVRLLGKLLKVEGLGQRVVPIVPDEARTFGMEALFRQAGIYSPVGQLYEPVDSDSLLYYREAKDGQILEEGITEAGAMCSFQAAGTAYATHHVCTIPFFIFYSMFGFQRIGDLIWAAADSRTHGFLVGGTAGRTTLNGEGLQHQDGHSHVTALAVPNLLAYDPAYAFEIAVIIRDGMERLVRCGEDLIYYMTVGNENYPHLKMPEGAEEGILKGLYRLRGAENQKAPLRAQLLGSGAILPEVLKAQERLAEAYDVHADVWSVTSYKSLYYDALEAERWNMLHPGKKPRVPYVAQCLADAPGAIIAASDYLKVLPDMISRHIGRPVHPLGT